jgi:hypothetical protein
MNWEEAKSKYFSRHRFYHFTDQRNLPSIVAAGGILSWREARRQGINIPAPGGNELSRNLATAAGLDDFVSLCFRSTHRMERAAV